MEVRQRQSDMKLKAELERVQTLEESLSESKQKQSQVESDVARLEAESRRYAAALDTLLQQQEVLVTAPKVDSGDLTPADHHTVRQVRDQWQTFIQNRSVDSLVALYDPAVGQFFGSLNCVAPQPTMPVVGATSLREYFAEFLAEYDAGVEVRFRDGDAGVLEKSVHQVGGGTVLYSAVCDLRLSSSIVQSIIVSAQFTLTLAQAGRDGLRIVNHISTVATVSGHASDVPKQNSVDGMGQIPSPKPKQQKARTGRTSIIMRQEMIAEKRQAKAQQLKLLQEEEQKQNRAEKEKARRAAEKRRMHARKQSQKLRDQQSPQQRQQHRCSSIQTPLHAKEPQNRSRQKQRTDSLRPSSKPAHLQSTMINRIDDSNSDLKRQQMDAAARRVQKLHRGRMAREAIREQHRAAARLQAVQRGKRARKLHRPRGRQQSTSQEVAASDAIYDDDFEDAYGSDAFDDDEDIEDMAEEADAAFDLTQATVGASDVDLDAAARRVQKLHRGRMAREAIREQHRAAARLQAVQRGKRARKLHRPRGRQQSTSQEVAASD
eukprot:SAG31_NODE_356_length_17180_cov_7.595925_1_plen_546_part_10